MEHVDLVNQLISQGYMVVGFVMPMNRFAADSVANSRTVFSIRTAVEELLNPRNRNKHLILLRRLSDGDQIELITDEMAAVNRANEQIAYQREPVGQIIRARCAVLGSEHDDERIFHVDRLIPSLNGLSEWEISMDETAGIFQAVLRLDNIEKDKALLAIERLEQLLNSLASVIGVGFRLQHHSIAHLMRADVSVSFGPTERNLQPLSQEQISRVEKMLSVDAALEAADGLNQSYVENLMPSRVARLWAAVEHLFSSEPKHLLSEDEIKELIACADRITPLANDDGRMKRLKEALKNPDRLSLKGRNERLADAIGPLVGITSAEALDRIRKISSLRGKHVHQLSSGDWEALRACEDFLQQVLQSEIQRQLSEK